MKLTSIIVALLALAAGLLIAGCGDDDDDATTTPAETAATGATGANGDTETKAQFIAAADEICSQADRELENEAVQQYPEGPPTGEDATAFAEEVLIPNLQGQYDQIAALTPPAGQEDAVADILEKLQSGIDEISENPGEFIESTALEDATTAAQEFGLKDCGQ